MSEHDVGSRVVAIAKADNETISIYGYGIYEGDFQHPYLEPPDSDQVIEMLKRSGFAQEDIDKLQPEDIQQMIKGFTSVMGKNPRIKLDNGKIVWGCECWWGPVEWFEGNFIQGREVQEIDIDADRAKYDKEPAGDMA
jgi:hypothetical protein